MAAMCLMNIPCFELLAWHTEGRLRRRDIAYLGQLNHYDPDDVC